MVKKHLEYYEWEEVEEFLVSDTGISVDSLSCLIEEYLYPDSGGIHEIYWTILAANVRRQLPLQPFSVEALVANIGESCFVRF